MSTNFLHPPFLILKLKRPVKLSSFPLATCLHFSRTETHSQINDVALDKYVEYCRTNLGFTNTDEGNFFDDLWLKMMDEARLDVEQEPILSNYYFTSIMSHDSMENALANYLSVKLSSSTLPVCNLFSLFLGVLSGNQEIIRAVNDDLRAVKERDPACISYVHCFLNFKGFLACQAHRIAHDLWCKGRKVLALTIQNRVSEVFAVDIHPGARIGRGILLDHATGLVIGETAVIGNNVSILHNVTLDGTGKESGDRHPKIGDGVLIRAGTCVLGNVVIEDGAKIGAGSVVLKRVPTRTTVVGNPAKLIGVLDKMPSLTMDHTSGISEWLTVSKLWITYNKLFKYEKLFRML